MVTLFLFVITSKYFLMLINGQTYIPTWVYDHLTPWQTEQKTPWNVLAADGIFEFLPWRKVVMEAVASGSLPIVNPYAAATLGGQPLLANGQSGFFYPLHWPFWILPSSLAPITLMVSVTFHMGILAVGTYLLAQTISGSYRCNCHGHWIFTVCNVGRMATACNPLDRDCLAALDVAGCHQQVLQKANSFYINVFAGGPSPTCHVFASDYRIIHCVNTETIETIWKANDRSSRWIVPFRMPVVAIR